MQYEQIFDFSTIVDRTAESRHRCCRYMRDPHQDFRLDADKVPCLSPLLLSQQQNGSQFCDELFSFSWQKFKRRNCMICISETKRILHCSSENCDQLLMFPTTTFPIVFDVYFLNKLHSALTTRKHHVEQDTWAQAKRKETLSPGGIIHGERSRETSSNT